MSNDELTARAARLVTRLPDEPRYVEARGLLLAGRGVPLPASPGEPEWVVDPAARCAFGTGTANAAAFGALVASCPDVRAAVVPELAMDVAASPSGWGATCARLHLHPDPERLGAPEPDVERPEPGASLSFELFPPSTADELVRAVALALPLAAMVRDGRALACAYAYAQTETLWDVSIDAAPGHRRRGHATACVRALVHDLRSRGLRPVWGAEENNAGSLALAARLGFLETDSVHVLVRADP